MLIFSLFFHLFGRFLEAEETFYLLSGIEVGSTLIRMSIAEVSLKDERKSIERIIDQRQATVFYAKDAVQNENILSESIYQEGLSVLKKYQAIAKELGVQEIQIVATDIFRIAENGRGFIKRLSQDLELEIEIIDQDQEGKLGFLSLTHALKHTHQNLSLENIIAWDSGSSSVQLSMISPTEELLVYKSPFGFFHLKNALQKFKNGEDSLSLTDIERLIQEIQEGLPEIPPALKDAVETHTLVRNFQPRWLTPSLKMEKGEVKEMIDLLLEEDRLIDILALYIIMDKLGAKEVLFTKVSGGNTLGLLLQD